MQFLWVALLGAPIAAAASPPYQQQLPQQLPMSPALMSALEQAGQLRGSQIPPQTNLAGYPAQPPMQMPAQMPAQEAPLPQQAAPQQAAPQLQQQQQQQAPPQQAPLDAAVEASVGLAADDSAAMEVKSAAPAAKKGSLPDMPALMGNSFETFGNLVFSLNTDADEVESQIHSLQQEETRRFAQRKAQLEQHLQEQRAATEALRVQVAQVEAQVEQLRRADEADTNKAEQLQDENQKLADQLRRSQAALGVAARRFQEHVAQDLNEMKNGLGAAEQESTAAALEATYPTQATQGAGTVAKADELSADELSADQPAQDLAAVQPAAAPVKAEKKKHHLLQKQHLVKSGAKSAAEAATKKVVGCNKKGCHIVSASMADELDDDEDEDEDQDELAALDEDCYFPKDGYDYEKHLKRVSRPGKGGVGVILEAPSKLAEDIGAPALPEFKETKEDQLLAVRRDLQDAQTQEEKDILRALDFADEYEEADEDWLDDIVGAGAAVPEDTMVWGPAAQEHRQMPDLDAFKAMYAKRLEPAEDDESDEEGEEREHVGHAGEAIDDDDFQKFLANEYGDEDIGECEEEEIAGHVELENCEEVLDEYIQGRREEEEKLRSIFEPQEAHFKRGDRLDDVPRTIDETKGLIEKFYFDGEHTDEESEEEVDDSEDRLWDCETVLSTLSNLSNRPGKIGRIKIAGPKKTEARAGGAKPLGSLTEGDEEKAERAAAKAESSEDDIVELPDVITTRDRDETAEEKKARKAGVKEMRRICRKMKKESKETYASEAAKLPGRTGGGDVRQKLRVTKL